MEDSKKSQILSMITMCSYLLLPAFAYIFYKFFNPPMVWISSSIVALIAMFFYIIRYKKMAKRKYNRAYKGFL